MLQCVVHIAEAGTGTDGRYTAGEVDGMHRCHVDDDPGGRGVSGEAVPTAAKCGLQAVLGQERDRLPDVFRRCAPHDRQWPDVVEGALKGGSTRSYGGEPASTTSPAITP